MSTKRVLVVAYMFPPVGGAGVQRVTKFIKYLPEFGWEATVLTVENPSVPVFDESLLAEIPPQTRVVRAPTLEPGYALKRLVSASRETITNKSSSSSTNSHSQIASANDSALKQAIRNGLSALKACVRKGLRRMANFVLQPDPQILWHHHAVDTGLRILAEQHHDVIFVTAPPFSTFLVGAELSRRTGVPLVLDYRDEWGINLVYEENRQQDRWSRWRQSRMQHSAVRAASALVATTKHSATALSQVAHDAGSQARVTHIYNGFDAADFHAKRGQRSDLIAQKLLNERDAYKLAYVGTLWNLTSVEPVVKAVQRLSEQSPELTGRLEMHFAGRRTAPQEKLLDQLNDLPCRVVRHQYLDHDAALNLMQSADGLLLLLSDVPHAERVVPAKLFEYLAVRKPIFAIGPRGEVSDLLQNCPLGFAHLPSDVDGLAQRLGDEVERHRLGVSLPTELWNVDQFERRQLTGQLAKLLNEVCEFSPLPAAVSPSERASDQEQIVAGAWA